MTIIDACDVYFFVLFNRCTIILFYLPVFSSYHNRDNACICVHLLANSCGIMVMTYVSGHMFVSILSTSK